MSSSFNIINRTGPPVSNSTSQYNSSTREQDLLPYELYQIPQAFIIIIVCLYGIIVFVSIGGNLVVCYTVFTVQRLRTVTNFFLASLSVSDMLMTVFCIPFTVMSNIIYHYWPFWGWMCPLVQYLQLVSVLQRAFTMVAIACDRHFVISKPLKKRISKAKARVMITLFWILAMLAAIPTAVYSKIVYLQYEPGSRGLCVEVWHDHESRYIYSVTIMMLQYFLPLFIMLCTYTHIGYMIWIKRPPGEADSSRDLRIASSKRKTLKMLFAVVVTYALTWLPLHVLTILGDVDPSIYDHMYAHIMWLTFHFVAFSNTGTNPIIYFYMNKTFRGGFLVLFNKILCVTGQSRSVRRFTVSLPTTQNQKSYTSSIFRGLSSKSRRKSNGSYIGTTEL